MKTELLEYIQKFEENFINAISDEINFQEIAQKLTRAKIIALSELIFERKFVKQGDNIDVIEKKNQIYFT